MLGSRRKFPQSLELNFPRKCLSRDLGIIPRKCLRHNSLKPELGGGVLAEEGALSDVLAEGL